mmetsp:Transcript_19165/g.23583  ORF Transcript_19165/g.23583 Transcript_19165/m.23583 type:complete len:291 (-) Transcript_19165:1751-2623(-)
MRPRLVTSLTSATSYANSSFNPSCRLCNVMTGNIPAQLLYVSRYIKLLQRLHDRTYSYSSRGDDHWEEGSRNSLKPRSPYNVLRLKTSATTKEIKNQFRMLAKKYHPDLNPELPSHISQAKMSELISAYDQLMNDDFLGRVGDGRVALACEMFTLEELKIDRFHDVHAIRIRYHQSESSSNIIDDNRKDKNIKPGTPTMTTSDVSTIIEIDAHPDDSVSDIKRQLQSIYLSEWGLDGRRLDRDNIATGWELVCKNIVTDSIEVMSYHLFLNSYDILGGDIIHAIVRKYET